MAYGSGFDIFPSLEPNNPDHAAKWTHFITTVLSFFEKWPAHWGTGPLIRHTGFLEFKVEIGQHPLLPFDGTKFRRFSVQDAYEVEPVVYLVFKNAKRVFGHRVSGWFARDVDANPCEIRGMKYGWAEVDESVRTYSTEEGVGTHVSQLSNCAV